MRNFLLGVFVGYLFSDAIDDVLGRSTLVRGESGDVKDQRTGDGPAETTPLS